MLVLGFVPALIFSWVYELTPEGLKREHEVERNRSITAETARKLDLTVGALLIVAITLLGINWYTGPRDDMPTPPRPGLLRRAAAGSDAPAAQASIAVLPFVNMSDDKANDYFSDGLSEELLNVLAKVQGLRVIARTSSFAFKGKDATIADVAKTLGVDHVLEGSVRKAGDRVRITAQLIRARDSSHLWSETYDRTLDDVFAIQDEISGQVVGALKVRLLGARTDLSEVGGTKNGQAYEAFLRGLHILSQGELEENLRDALAAFDLAVAEDPSMRRRMPAAPVSSASWRRTATSPTSPDSPAHVKRRYRRRASRPTWRRPTCRLHGSRFPSTRTPEPHWRTSIARSR